MLINRVSDSIGRPNRVSVGFVFVAAILLNSTTGQTSDRQITIDASSDAVQSRISESVDYLASDELEGRGVRTRGLDIAAEYLHDQFRQAGLRTDIYQGGPFQEFKLYSRATKGAVQELTFEISGEEPASLTLGESYTSLTLSVLNRFRLPVVFAGYGITAPEWNYDDYADVNVAGAAVIILRHEPQQDDPNSVFNGLENSEHAFLRPKIDNAARHGASAVIICTDNFTLQSTKGETGQEASSQTDELIDVELDESSLKGGAVPVVHCKRDVIERLIRRSFDEELVDLEERIDETLQPQSRRLTRARAAGRVGLSKDGRSLRNVVAAVDGTGELAEETVVIGAHYDHLGRGGWGSLAIGANEEIHNGADDNASGTAILLEVARQLAAHPQPLKRRVLFIAFSAEELGLIGSKRYVENPAVPLDQTIAMLNLDMVGRLRNDKLTIYGTGTAAEWTPILDRLETPHQFDLKRRSGGYGPSDHASFYEQGIPVLHFFTGFHSQYHRPSDDSDLLNVEGMARIAALVRDITLELVQADERPTKTSHSMFDLDELDDFDGDLGLNLPSDRPLLGVVLDEVDGGVKVRRLIREAAAERHGIRPGDVLFSVNDKPVKTTEDVIETLKSHERGTPLKVALTRRGVELELEIPL